MDNLLNEFCNILSEYDDYVYLLDKPHDDAFFASCIEDIVNDYPIKQSTLISNAIGYQFSIGDSSIYTILKNISYDCVRNALININPETCKAFDEYLYRSFEKAVFLLYMENKDALLTHFISSAIEELVTRHYSDEIEELDLLPESQKITILNQFNKKVIDTIDDAKTSNEIDLSAIHNFLMNLKGE